MNLRRGVWCVCLLLCVAQSQAPGAGVGSGLYFGESVRSMDQRAFAMGGAGLGATGGYPDAMNPASLGRAPIASFNVTYRPCVNWGEDGSASQRLTSGRLSSASFSLPIGWGVTLGAGFEQIHGAQYRWANACTTATGLAYTRALTREGGVWAGGVSVAARIADGLHVGAGWRWLFGSIRTRSRLDFAEPSFTDTDDELSQRHSGSYPALGVLWTPGKVGIGLYWRGSSEGPGRFTLRTTHHVERSTSFSFRLPARWGCGVGVGPFSGVSLTADVWRESWEGAHYADDSSAFRTTTTAGVGVEVMPILKNRPLPVRVGYRWGSGYYLLPLPDGSRSAEPPKDRAVTFGTAVGAGDGRSVIQVGIAIGSRGDLEEFRLRERYLEASVGFTGLEPWTRRSLPGA